MIYFSESHTSSPVPSFYERLECIKECVEFDCFDERDKLLAHECCLVICEVLTQVRSDVVRISGEDLDGDMVRGIFASLEHEHIEHVISNYKSIKHEIKRKKQYLRAALYNSYFELEAAIINAVSDVIC